MKEIPLSDVANWSVLHSLIGKSDSRVTVMGTDPRAIRRERCKRPEPEDLLGRPPPRAASVGAAHADFVAEADGRPPHLIPLEANPLDLKTRAGRPMAIQCAAGAFVAVVLHDTAQNAAHGKTGRVA